MRYLSLSIAVLAGALAAGSASGAVVSYSNTRTGVTHYNADLTTVRSLWESAVSGLQTVTFGTGGGSASNSNVLVIDPMNAFTNPSSTSTCAAVTLTNAQVCFERLSASNRSWVDVGGAGDPIPDGNRYFRGQNGNATNIRPNSNARAFALDLYTLGSGGQNVIIQVYDSTGMIGEYNPVPTNNNTTPAFFGVTSDTVITSVRISSFSSEHAIDSFHFANALAGPPEPPPSAETPESATLGYISIGLIILLFSRKRITHVG